MPLEGFSIIIMTTITIVMMTMMMQFWQKWIGC